MSEKQSYYIEIVIDDKGGIATLKQLDDAGKRVETSIGGAARGVDQFEKSMGKATAGGVALGVGMERFAEKVVGGATDAGAAIAMAGARMEQLGGVMDYLGKQAGYSQQYLHQLAQGMQNTGITGREATETIIQFVRYGWDLENVLKLQAAAQNSAAIAGRNSSEVLGDLMRGISLLHPVLLKSAGYTVDLKTAEEEYREETGKSATALDGKQKQLLLMNAVLRQANDLQGVYNVSMNYAAKQWQSAERAWMQAAETMGAKVNPATAVAMKLWYEFGTTVRDYPETFLALGAAITVTATALLGFKIVETLPDKFLSLKNAIEMMTTTRIGVLALGAGIAGLAIAAGYALSSYVEHQAAAALSAEELAAKQDVVNRAIEHGAQLTITYAEAQAYLQRVQRAKYGEPKKSSAGVDVDLPNESGHTDWWLWKGADTKKKEALAVASLAEQDYHNAIDGVADALRYEMAVMKESGKTAKELAIQYGLDEDQVKRFIGTEKQLAAEHKLSISADAELAKARASIASEGFTQQAAVLRSEHEFRLKLIDAEIESEREKGLKKLAEASKYHASMLMLEHAQAMKLRDLREKTNDDLRALDRQALGDELLMKLDEIAAKEDAEKRAAAREYSNTLAGVHAREQAVTLIEQAADEQRRILRITSHKGLLDAIDKLELEDAAKRNGLGLATNSPTGSMSPQEIGLRTGYNAKVGTVNELSIKAQLLGDMEAVRQLEDLRRRYDEEFNQELQRLGQTAAAAAAPLQSVGASASGIATAHGTLASALATVSGQGSATASVFASVSAAGQTLAGALSSASASASANAFGFKTPGFSMPQFGAPTDWSRFNPGGVYDPSAPGAVGSPNIQIFGPETGMPNMSGPPAGFAAGAYMTRPTLLRFAGGGVGVGGEAGPEWILPDKKLRETVAQSGGSSVSIAPGAIVVQGNVDHTVMRTMTRQITQQIVATLDQRGKSPLSSSRRK